MKTLIATAAVLLGTAAMAQDAGMKMDADMQMMHAMMSPEMMQMKIDRMNKISEMTGLMAQAMELNMKGMKDKAMKDHMMVMMKEHKAMSASAKKMADEMTKHKDMKMPADMKMDPKAMEMMKKAMMMEDELFTMMQKEHDMKMKMMPANK